MKTPSLYRTARVQAGYTQVELAETLGLSVMTVIKLEAGGVPSVPTLQRYHEVLGLSFDDMMAEHA